jgi:transposase
MQKNDGRKLDDSTRVFLKKRAKELYKTGKPYREIGEILGLHLNTIARWLNSDSEARSTGFKKRRRKTGEQRTLTMEQEMTIKKLIRDKNPEQLKLPFALWTRKAIRDLIMRLFGVKIPIRTMGEYLRRWGYTPQRPLKRAYEQRPQEIKKWLDARYPEIRARAQREGAEIHWGDETGVNNQDNYGRSYSPQGQTPVIQMRAKRQALSMVSAITNQGTVRFMVYKGGMNTTIFKRFLCRLIKDSSRKVFLIVDNLRVHHSYALDEWLDEHKEKLELFFLPSYAPERNPDEYLNNDLKRSIENRPIADSFKELAKNVISHMRKLQKMPHRAMSFFKHPSVVYAA